MARVLRDRVAIVTGASSGVGWLSALRLAEEGMKVCVTARRADALETLRGEIELAGGTCLVVPGDVTVDTDVERVVATCFARFGRIDLLVNNAAVQVYDRFEAYAWSDITRVLDVTFLGYLRFARAVLPHMRAQGDGHILNVASMLAKGAAPLLSAYSAAKHAALGWAKALRLELLTSGIDVSNVLLPSVSTPMFDHAPMRLGRKPQPVPPTYDTEVAARAVVRVAKRPQVEHVPVFLQGRALLFLDRWAPWLGDFVMSRFGERLQMRPEPQDPREGNLWTPIARGVGPYGSVPPTALWKRALPLLAALSLVSVGARLIGVRSLVSR